MTVLLVHLKRSMGFLQGLSEIKMVETLEVINLLEPFVKRTKEKNNYTDGIINRTG